MKRMVLILVLFLLGVQLSGVPGVKNLTALIDGLYVVPKHGRYANLEETPLLQNKEALYLSPLQSKTKSSSNTNVPNPRVSILVDKSSIRIVIRHLFHNGMRPHKYKPIVFKPNSFRIKVPP